MILRQRLTFLLTILIALTLIAGSALSAMAIFAPFYAGDPLFPIQRWAEEVRFSLVFDKFELASQLIDLAELRLMDLGARIGSEHELLALQYLDEAVNAAVVAVDAVPAEQAGPLYARLARLAANIQAVLGQLRVVPVTQPDIYTRASVKAAVLLEITSGKSADKASSVAAINISPATNNESKGATTASSDGSLVVIPPHGVPFPPNARPGSHALFPLTGQHAVIACASCHVNNVYRGTPSQCETCHAQVKPVNHFPGACDTCHTTSAWKPATFNHTGFTDCVACHTKNKPANHFEGQCSTCHSTTAWKPALFDHTGLTDCVACHTKNKPANHFEGQCSTCHATTAWKPATFNHTGLTDCVACHTKNKPANHFEGQCSTCHATTAWKPATFNHTGLTDCVACHTK
ncbi:MAG: cytochrome c3 family protein, partial [Chloroflexi bacterium]|nr:cytochrome c3 family protein [Chloroflexota bacterium]